MFLEEGVEIDLRFRLGSQISDCKGAVEWVKQEEGGPAVAGVRWLTGSQSGQKKLEHRSCARRPCDQEFYPTGVASHSVRTEDTIHFRVCEMSGGGLRLLTSLRNKHFAPNMELDSQITVPGIGQIRVRLAVVHADIVTEVGREYLTIGTRFVDSKPETFKALDRYLQQFGPRVRPKLPGRNGLICESKDR